MPGKSKCSGFVDVSLLVTLAGLNLLSQVAQAGGLGTLNFKCQQGAACNFYQPCVAVNQVCDHCSSPVKQRECLPAAPTDSCIRLADIDGACGYKRIGLCDGSGNCHYVQQRTTCGAHNCS